MKAVWGVTTLPLHEGCVGIPHTPRMKAVLRKQDRSPAAAGREQCWENFGIDAQIDISYSRACSESSPALEPGSETRFLPVAVLPSYCTAPTPHGCTQRPSS